MNSRGKLQVSVMEGDLPWSVLITVSVMCACTIAIRSMVTAATHAPGADMRHSRDGVMLRPRVRRGQVVRIVVHPGNRVAPSRHLIGVTGARAGVPRFMTRFAEARHTPVDCEQGRCPCLTTATSPGIAEDAR